MDNRTAKILDRATREFYEACAQSFSETRQAPWPGWLRLLGHVPRSTSMSVLDLGCGNLRFERFLKGELAEVDLTFHAVDRCTELACDVPADVNFINEDIGADPHKALSTVPKCELCVSFAMLHHLPHPEVRKDVLYALLSKTRPKGVACVSFWQFAKSRKLMKKSLEATEKGSLKLGVHLDTNAGDFLLGWQGREDAYRYCHSFSDSEVSEMCFDACSATQCRMIDEYSADGKSDDLNRYVVFQRDVD